MAIVIRELRTQINMVQKNLALANQAGLGYEADLHRARLQDLMDIAARVDIDVTPWVDQSLLPPLAHAVRPGGRTRDETPSGRRPPAASAGTCCPS
jgi:hypothetical protein